MRGINISFQKATVLVLSALFFIFPLTAKKNQVAAKKNRVITKKTQVVDKKTPDVDKAKSQELPVPEIGNIVAYIDSVTIEGLIMVENVDSLTPVVNDSLVMYIQSNTDVRQRARLTDHYEALIIAASEQENADSLFTSCSAVIAMNDGEILNMAYEGLAQYYAFRGNPRKLDIILKQFEEYSSTLPRDPYNGKIAEMRKEYEDILNRPPFIDLVKGKWLCMNWKSKTNGFPYFALTIDSLSPGGIRLDYLPGESHNSPITDLVFQSSRAVGGEYGRIKSIFASDHLKVGNYAFAKRGFEGTRDLRAQADGIIWSSKAGLGTKIGTQLAVHGLTALLDIGLAASAQSSKRVKALNMVLDYRTPIVMTGSAKYYNYSATVDNMDYVNTRPLFDNEIVMVKMEPDDGIFFVEDVDKIYSLTPMEKLDLTKYNEIKNKYSWKRGKYLWKTIGGLYLGTGVMAGGIMWMFSSFKTDERDAKGNIKYNKGWFWGGYCLMIGGMALDVVTINYVTGKRIKDRQKAFGELNAENMKKLETKGTLSIQPQVDPVTNYYGIGTSLTF